MDGGGLNQQQNLADTAQFYANGLKYNHVRFQNVKETKAQ